MAKTSLYRHFDADGVLLYVGISIDHISRLLQHRYGSDWFYDIASVTIEHFDTPEEAVEAENLAIVGEKPVYNKKHGLGPNAPVFRKIMDKMEAFRQELSEDDFGELIRLCKTITGADPTNIKEMQELTQGKRKGTLEVFPTKTEEPNS